MYGVPGLVDARLYSVKVYDLCPKPFKYHEKPMTMTRRAARRKLGTRTTRRQSTKRGTAKTRRPRPRSRLAEIIRTR